LRRTRILVVDDDAKVVDSLRLYLEHAGYEVAAAGDGQRAIDSARSFQPDLVVLDVMLPRGDGLLVCRTLRAESEVPILFLTARATEEDRLEGLDLGADDYVTKPFSPRELVARVRAILRRARGEGEPGNGGAPESETAPIRLPGLVVDPSRHEVTVRGERVDLTPREFRLLHALARDPGRAMTRDELAERAFGPEYEGLARTVDAHVANLRRKIEPDPASPVFVETVFGIGYRLRRGRRAP
jgi:two-component system, OmpR family, alkaline phosphatase synthesis response regulator PhoP